MPPMLLSGRLVPSLVALLFLLGCNHRFEFDVPRDGGEDHAEADDDTSPPDGSAAGEDDSESDDEVEGPRTHDCDEDEECLWANLHCDLLTRVCVECVVDDDCGGSKPYCDRSLHRCVECAVDQNCDDGFVCDGVVRRCQQRCDDDNDCPAQSHGCDERRRVCIACDADIECRGNAAGAVCGIGGDGCVQCRRDDQCEGTLCDVLSGQCVECRDTRDCAASSACDPQSSRCVAP